MVAMADSPVSVPSAGELLRDVASYDLADHVVGLAEALVGNPAGLYVADIAGTELRRVAGSPALPAVLAIPSAIGPEMPRRQAEEIQTALREIDRNLSVVPLWLRHRAIAVIVCVGHPPPALDDLARESAAAMELIGGYTDQFASARRREQVSPPAQLQQDLLPPRISAARGVDIAASILPAYDVGGDWFDHSTSEFGAWMAVGDAMGKGLRAAALSALAVAAQRSVRQAGGSLIDAARTMHDAVLHGGEDEAFMTTILASWDARNLALSWINCGHPPPLLHRAGQPLEPLSSRVCVPLGLTDLSPTLELAHVVLQPGDQVLLYSDGVTERRRADGEFFGTHGVQAALAGPLGRRSAASTVTALQRAVMAASDEDLRDDATIMAIEVTAVRPSDDALRC